MLHPERTTTQPAASAPRRRKKLFQYGCLGIVALVLGCAVLGSLLDTNTQAVSAPTPVLVGDVEPTTAEPTLAPTEAPVPTEPPVPTEAPTLAPAPAEAGLSDEARAYFGAASGPLGDYGKWLGRLGEQSMKVGGNTDLLTDMAWKVDTTVAIVGLRLAAGQLDALDASGTEADEIGRLVQRIVDETGPMTNEYTQGLDGLDTSLLTSAARVRTIGGLVDQMNTEMARLQ